VTGRGRDVQLLQIGEAPEAGAEIIEGKAAAEVRDGARERLSGIEVSHERGLGELEDNV
jgi:hypothetical protein